MRYAWLTPEDDHAGLTCYQIVLPDGLEWLAAFWGAFLLLADSDNWEESGSQTPEYVAAEWLTAFFNSQDGWQECP